VNPEATVQSELEFLLAPHGGPCLSIYLPTHRRHPENQQDPIRYKNLVKALEDAVRQRFLASDEGISTLLESFRKLGGDKDFWNHTWDGLAVLGAPGVFRVIKLQRAVPELSVAADSFHLKPLLRIQQSSGRYQVLSLNRGQIRLFEGNRDYLDPVELAPGVPRTVEEALGDEFTKPHQTVTSHGGTALGSNMRHGHGSKKDEVDIDEERFFRAVDRALLEHHCRNSGMPLILAALPQYHTPFRRVSHHPMLAERGIDGDANAMTIDQLRERAWSAVEPEFRARLAKMTEAYTEAQAKGLGSDEVARVGEAAAQSRVGTLLVEAERRIPGVLDTVTGQVTFHSPDDPLVDDLLDDLAELVLRRGGDVVVVPAADMPTAKGLAATYRF
jgi:hypothetical protein